MYIDTHAHLNFKAFSNDYSAAILRAQNAGVEKIINIGSNLETSKKAILIAKENQNIYAAVGLHPIHVKDENFTSDFEKLAKGKKVVAIGETGLDYYSGVITRFRQQTGSYYHNNNNQELQKEVFQKHLNLARLLSKPVILHNRDAGEDVLSVLTSQSPMPRGVMHCFAENWDYAQVILDMGFYISFTGVITFTKNYPTLEVVKNIPLDRLMIETDCPYLTPESHRGERNEPAFVAEVAKKIAEIKKIPVEKIAEATTQNAKELFKI